MPEDLFGGCKCGLVRYRGACADVTTFRCHCRDCQQLTGTGHADMLPLVAEAFDISESCKAYTMTGGSGRATYSGFCPICGSPLTRRSDLMPDRVYVHAASLDDPSLYMPARSIYADAAQPWDDAVIESDP